MFSIPLIFTFGNLFSGMCAVFFIMQGDSRAAAVFMLVAVAFDVLDGKIARLLGQETKLGEYLDSLADIVSFGIPPAILIYNGSLFSMIIGMLFMGAGAYRLARFHVQKKVYRGMPITINGVIVPIIIFSGFALLQYWLVLSAILMISTFKLR